MIYSEMLSLKAAIEDTSDDAELQAVMDRIKRDIELRKDGEHAWATEQVSRARRWCRRHREWLAETDAAADKACYGWMADRASTESDRATD